MAHTGNIGANIDGLISAHIITIQISYFIHVDHQYNHQYVSLLFILIFNPQVIDQIILQLAVLTFAHSNFLNLGKHRYRYATSALEQCHKCT